MSPECYTSCMEHAGYIIVGGTFALIFALIFSAFVSDTIHEALGRDK